VPTAPLLPSTRLVGSVSSSLQVYWSYPATDNGRAVDQYQVRARSHAPLAPLPCSSTKVCMRLLAHRHPLPLPLVLSPPSSCA
jgi:hypothetical protein